MPKILAIRVEAHCLDHNVLLEFLQDYGVRCTDPKNAPWDVEFTGPETGLRKMLDEHWCMDYEEVEQLIAGGTVK